MPASYAYLGPEGTFTEVALRTLPESATRELVPMVSVPAALDAFAEDFEQRHAVPVERLYVAKLLYGLVALAEEGGFPRGTAVAAVVTGRPFP